MTRTASQGLQAFHGFPPDALAFYRELAASPTKEWWVANKPRYDAGVREPMEALVDALEDEFAPAKLFRPYADVRFAKGRSPYKDHQGAIAMLAEGLGWYVHIDADGLRAGGGLRSHGPDQVRRLRAAVDAPASGADLESIIKTLRRKGFEIWGQGVATRPRGVPADHPRLELMRMESVMTSRDLGAPAWLHTAAAAKHVATQWRSVRPLVDWMLEHVGPTAEPRRRR